MQTHLVRVLVALPLLSLFLGAVAWLRYGIDMPWFDDWRGYADGTIRSLDPRYLFRPMNDTMAPVGFALDALAQRFLDGNSVAYQFLSMLAVLGALLLLQWKLLNRTLENRLLASLCFAFTLFMLQPDSYWGRENLAYHQCVPLIFILSAVWIMVCTEVGRWWHGPVLLGLGLLSGFTYISGAFGALTAGMALLVVSGVCWRGEPRRRLFRNALWFTSAGVATAAAQYYFAIMPIKRGIDAAIPMSLPHEAQFWAFFLGKLGRSLLLPSGQPELSLTLTILACAAAAAFAVWLIARAAGPKSSLQDQRLATIYLTIGAVVFVYMMMVAAGRTRYRPPEVVQLLDVFSFGFTRFHFFWATLLWPWLVAAILMSLRRRPDDWRFKGVVAALVLVLATSVIFGTAYRHMGKHKELAQARSELATCLLDKLQKEGPVECIGLIPPRFNVVAPDAYGPYAHAWNINASFVRNFPVFPDAQRADKIPPFYQMRRFIGKLRVVEMEYLGDYTLAVTGGDPRLLVDSGQHEIMGSCLDLAVEVDIKAEVGGPAQLFWLERGSSTFAEKRSQVLQVNSGQVQTLRFRVKSTAGFSNPLRLDPAAQAQELEIPDFRVYCLQRKS